MAHHLQLPRNLMRHVSYKCPALLCLSSRLEPLAQPASAVQRAAFIPLFKGGKRIHLAVQASRMDAVLWTRCAGETLCFGNAVLWKRCADCSGWVSCFSVMGSVV